MHYWKAFWMCFLREEHRRANIVSQTLETHETFETLVILVYILFLHSRSSQCDVDIRFWTLFGCWVQPCTASGAMSPFGCVFLVSPASSFVGLWVFLNIFDQVVSLQLSFQFSVFILVLHLLVFFVDTLHPFVSGLNYLLAGLIVLVVAWLWVGWEG